MGGDLILPGGMSRGQMGREHRPNVIGIPLPPGVDLQRDQLALVAYPPPRMGLGIAGDMEVLPSELARLAVKVVKKMVAGRTVCIVLAEPPAEPPAGMEQLERDICEYGEPKGMAIRLVSLRTEAFERLHAQYAQEETDDGGGVEGEGQPQQGEGLEAVRPDDGPDLPAPQEAEG